MFPVIAASLVAVLLALPRTKPFGDGSGPSRFAYGRAAVVAVAGVALMHAGLLGRALGWAVDVPRVILVIVGMMLAVMGNEMPNVRRNPWIGIRTPWTLASDAVWKQTHHVGRWLLIALGVATALAGALLPNWVGIIVVIAGAIGLCVWSMAYSYAKSKR
jgi:uncharacterized membrane protein